MQTKQVAWNKAKQLDLDIRKEVLSRTRIVFSTLMGCGHHLLRGGSGSGSKDIGGREHFDVIVCDEAANCTVPAAAVALQLLEPVRGRCIFAGDPLQLPPTVHYKISCSFFFFARLPCRLAKPLF